jgi:ubiquitin carboxyl-terminal hydrolase 8
MSEQPISDTAGVSPALGKYYQSEYAYNDGLIRVKGFRNLGNTCYMNAGLQALLSSNILNSRIIRYTQDNPGEISELSPMLFEYVKLIYQLIDANADNETNASPEARQTMREMREQKFMVPRDFKDTLSKEHKTFAGYSQQDSHEMLTFMLDDFTELPKAMRPPKPKLKEGEVPSPPVFTSIRKVLRDTYFGTYRQVIKCLECGNKADTVFNHTDIVLPIPRDLLARNRQMGRTRDRRSTINIANCFEKYSETETFEGDNKIDCSECKIRTESTKRWELDYVPELTILTINRFEGLNKIDEPIKIFPKIELDGYPLRLISTVNHMGSTARGGHYTAYVSRAYYDDAGVLQEKWYNADDSSVREINKRQVLSDPRVYLAIYERVQDVTAE